MCVEEYIAYQCGHRSFAVLRVCPSTTNLHNLPVCANHPVRQFTSETMCSPCERLMHTRWVLIREWEHRWYHERGACGCPVIFPDLFTRPRVIGGPAPEAPPALPANPIWLAGPETMSAGVPTFATAPAQGAPSFVGSGRGFAPPSGPASATRGSSLRGRGRGGRATNTSSRGGGAVASGSGSGASVPSIVVTPPREEASGSSGPSTSPAAPVSRSVPSAVPVPPVYTETTIGNESHIAVRLPGLYAAEWMEDHRVLHRALPNHCPVETRPVRHILDEDNMDADEHAFLEDCRLLAGVDHIALGTGEYLAATAARLGNIFPRISGRSAGATTTSLSPAAAALSSGQGPFQAQRLNHAGPRAVTHTLPEEIAALARSERPILGLPIGAGPEGTSHMPAWGGCRLGRPVVKRRRSAEF